MKTRLRAVGASVLATAWAVVLVGVAAGAEGEAAPDVPANAMRVVRAEIVDACQLYHHPGGWEFGPAKTSLEVTLAIKTAALKGRRLTDEEKARLKNAQIGDCAVIIDHRHFRVMNQKGNAKNAAGMWHSEYEPLDRVPDQYLVGHETVDSKIKVAWRCLSLVAREHYFDSKDTELTLRVVFPGVGPGAAATVRYQNWPPVSIGAVIAPEIRAPLETIPKDVLRVVSVKDMKANAVAYRNSVWMVSPAMDAAAVTVAIKTAHMAHKPVSAAQKAGTTPAPAGDQMAIVDPRLLMVRLENGTVAKGNRPLFTGLTAGAILDHPRQQQTGPGGTLWTTDNEFRRQVFFRADDEAFTITILFVRVKAAEITAVRFGGWPPVPVK